MTDNTSKLAQFVHTHQKLNEYSLTWTSSSVDGKPMETSCTPGWETLDDGATKKKQ